MDRSPGDLIRDAVKKSNRSPWDINNGDCEPFAIALHKKLPGSAVFDYMGVHAFVKNQGKFYDAETPEGVLDWRKLEFFKGEDVSKFDDSDIEQKSDKDIQRAYHPKAFKKEIELYEARTPSVYYHVTHTALVPKIMKEGFRPGQTSNWVKAADKKRYGKGEVNAFNNKQDAIRWAGKMDWAINKQMGSGKISIISFKPGENEWQVDKESDPLTQVQYTGDWLKSHDSVKPEDIVSVVPVTPKMIRTIIR